MQKAFPGTVVACYRTNFDEIRMRVSFLANHSVRQVVEGLKAALDKRIIRNYKDLRYQNQLFPKVAGIVRNKDEGGGL